MVNIIKYYHIHPMHEDSGWVATALKYAQTLEPTPAVLAWQFHLHSHLGDESAAQFGGFGEASLKDVSAAQKDLAEALHEEGFLKAACELITDAVDFLQAAKATENDPSRETDEKLAALLMLAGTYLLDAQDSRAAHYLGECWSILASFDDLTNPQLHKVKALWELAKQL